VFTVLNSAGSKPAEKEERLVDDDADLGALIELRASLIRDEDFGYVGL